MHSPLHSHLPANSFPADPASWARKRVRKSPTLACRPASLRPSWSTPLPFSTRIKLGRVLVAHVSLPALWRQSDVFPLLRFFPTSSLPDVLCLAIVSPRAVAVDDPPAPSPRSLSRCFTFPVAVNKMGQRKRVITDDRAILVVRSRSIIVQNV